MGQNCVAGTTELDEEGGIGLVLYVNSESNLIVWKMSDGTKQGTAVPLTTEYQSMLKSEFENKTGETIGYIIIHRYTEETIDIESSITINSGDTPEESHVKVASESSGQYWFGKYVRRSGSMPIVMMACQMNTSNLTLTDATGTVIARGANPIDLVTERIKSQMAAARKSVEDVQVWNLDIATGSKVENWDTYQEIPAI